MCRITIWLISLLFALSGIKLAAEDVYKALQEIPVGGEGGWDILTVDPTARRLYLSHATKIVVIDIHANKIVGEIGDTPGVHEFLAVPELKRGFSSNGKENKSSVIDLDTLSTIGKIDTGESPDAMAYDRARHAVYVFNHRGNSATVIDAVIAKPIATISLDGHPEFAVADDTAGRIYCNIEDKNEVAVIDTAKHQVIANWPIAPGEEPTGIALDTAHHRLFATCKKLMVMLDTESGKAVATLPIGNGADGCAFDDVTQLVFASCGEGVTIIAKVDGQNRLALVQTLNTQRGARTIALDPKTHRIFLPTAQFEPVPSPSPGASPVRPLIVPNTQKLMVYGPTKTSSK
jgi:YVTN family beta-propeller protein